MARAVALSVAMLAVGAILLWAVTATVAGISLDTVGIILLVAGFVALLASLRASAGRSDRAVPPR